MDHRWKFYRAGGLDQLVFRSGKDIVNLRSLDQKLWVALACPIQGLAMDERTLALLDTDKDGRIRPPELIAAVEWLKEVYTDPDELMTSRDFIPLSAISEKTEAGRSMLSTARRVLELVGKAGAARVELADVEDRAKLDAAVVRNGDGIIPPEAADEPEVQAAIVDILATHGKSRDRSGKDGVEQAHVDAFFADVLAYLSWAAKADSASQILPLGAATEAAAKAVQAVRAKVDDYFTRCRLAAFDPRTVAVLSGTDADFSAVAGQALASSPPELTKLPLARIEAERPLPLSQGINPAWAEALRALAASAVAPLLGPGKTSLTEADWQALLGRLAEYDAWQAEKPGTKLEGIGIPRLREHIVRGVQRKISHLIAADAALASEYAKIEELEKLIRCQRDLLKLLKNYVSFAEFYGRTGATFLAGTLYLDGRACSLCIPVRDAGKHAALAGLSKVYLAYCDLTRAGAEKQSIVAAFTDGDIDNLMVGRNGIFYDHKGQDWDATITKIIDSPISIRQAFFSPYKSLIRLIEEQVAKRASAAESDSKKRVEETASATAQADKTKIGGDAKVEKKGIDVGTVAAIGVAVGGIATFITPLFAAALTELAAIPKGSERALKDPFAEKRSLWELYLLLLVLLGVGLAWYAGRIDPLLPAQVKSTKVLGKLSPAYKPPLDSLGKQ